MNKTSNNYNNEIGYYVMIIGLFMAILDIQIVASSLGEIQANLSASLDEISWVQTAYLIAEVIIIPVTGYLTKCLSTRLLFAIGSLGFTIASVCCALAWNLESMIIARAIQGLFGGVMIPSVFSAVYIIFPKEKQAKATIIAGLVATIAPTLGPTLGGYLTNSFSWHWLFLMNLVPGIIVFFGVLRYLNINQPNFNLLKQFDYLGFILIIITLGSLELLLKNGPKNDWFETHYIIYLFVTLVIAGVSLIMYELNHHQPIIEFRAFSNSNFTIGCILSFGIGVGLFGSVYLTPILLTSIKGYNSLQIGLIMWVVGLFQLFSGPIAGILEKKIDLRLMLAIGLSTFASGLILNSFMNIEVSFNELFLPQALRGLALMLCFLPMTSVALGRLNPKDIANASGLYNLMRNLGGAVGIALIDYYLKLRTKFHYSYLTEQINPNNLGLNEQVEPLINSTDYLIQNQLSLKLIAELTNKQALIKAFNDTYLAIGIYLLICLTLLLLVKPVEVQSTTDGH